MSVLSIVPYLVCFVVGVAFGKFVKFLDFQGSQKYIQVSHGDNVNQVQIGQVNNVHPETPLIGQEDD